jgi:hypothetical protein
MKSTSKLTVVDSSVTLATAISKLANKRSKPMTVADRVIKFLKKRPGKYFTSHGVASRTNANHNTVRKELGMLSNFYSGGTAPVDKFYHKQEKRVVYGVPVWAIANAA